jgi:general secretion pathway protein J
MMLLGTYSKPAGFTLIELLVALAIFGLLMVGLAAGVRYGIKAWGHETRLAGASDDLDVTDRALRRLVQSAEADAVVTGTAGQLVWTGLLPPSGERAELMLTIASGGSLVLRSVPDPHVERLGPPPAAVETVLLDGVEGIDFYYWQDKGPGGPGWQRTWKADGMPRLLRVHLRFAEGDPRHWPDFVLAPMPGAS